MTLTKVVAGPNGGTVVELTPEEELAYIADQQTAANRPPTADEILEAARQKLMTLPVTSRAAHYTSITNILTAISRNDMEVAMHILAGISPANSDEEIILGEIKALFGI